MVQPNELRIGNIIEGKFIISLNIEMPVSKTITLKGTVEEILIDICKIKEFNETYIDYESIYPVKLTEEILLKCGFEKIERNSETYYRLGDFFEVWRLDDNGHCGYTCGDNLTGNFISTSVDYLHQLQNLYFVISGAELEIKL